MGSAVHEQFRGGSSRHAGHRGRAHLPADGCPPVVLRVVLKAVTTAILLRNMVRAARIFRKKDGSEVPQEGIKRSGRASVADARFREAGRTPHRARPGTRN